MGNIVVAGIVLIIIGAALLYIRKEKKKGVRCIGCPAAGTCASAQKGGSQCSCGCHSEKEI